MGQRLDHIRAYYAALNRGDPDEVASYFTDDAVHYSRGSGRGTEWFRFRDGKICEVRAYHHSNAKNRSGDLLGFDHPGRGYTTL